MKKITYYLVLFLLIFSCSSDDSGFRKVPFTQQETGPDNMVQIVEGTKDPAPESDRSVTITDEPIKIQRKLIWSADLEFQVKNVDESTKGITKLSTQFDGFISDVELTNNNYQISNQITVRVSNDNFHEFINACKGESVFLDRANISSNDVTEEFVDIESRLKTKREVRERYIQILRDKTGSIRDVLEAEEAIRKITEEIEAKEGRLRFLKDRVDHSTVVMTIYEKVDYVDQPERYEKGYGEDLSSSFNRGWQAITNIFLGIVTIWPLFLFLGILYWRRKWVIKLFSGKL